MNKVSLFLYFCFSSLVLRAQITSTIDLFEPVGDINYTIAADVDLDNDLDIICATSKRLFWIEQLEGGIFSKHRVISTAGVIYKTIVAADINEDGLDDIVYTSNELGVGAFLNLGNGTFDTAFVIGNLSTAIDCYLSDLNADGHLDIIASTPSTVHWILGNGDGSFGDTQLLSDEHATTTSVHAEDLDNDGDQDILLTSLFSNRLAWHENLGNNTFSDYHEIDTLYSGPVSTITADFDGDGLADIVCANRTEDQGGAGLVWYKNLGNGNFEFADTLMGRGFHSYVEVADMDGDGDTDIISTQSLSEMDWLENDGAGNFSEPIELERYAVYLRFLQATDISGDGLPDILYGINNSGTTKEAVLWRKSIGAGQFEAPALLSIGARRLSIPRLADFDQDGMLDVVVGSENTDALVWFRNEGFEFSPPKLIARRHNYDPSSIAVADINNDGWPDVFAGSIQDGTNSSVFCFYINNGDGSFTASAPFETFYFTHRDLELVDLDNDGDLDMLWAQPGYNGLPNSNIGWVRNEGSTWSEPILLWTDIVEVLDVLVADFNENGQKELVVCKRDAPRLSIMEHIEDGIFSEPVEIPSNFTGAMFAQAEDINGDGLKDLIASTQNTGGDEKRLAWWANLGKSQFDLQQDLHVGNPPAEKFAVKDFDLDGNKDIVLSTYINEPMHWMQKQADGTFSAPQVIEGTAVRTKGFLLEDIDGDGDLDIIGNGDDNEGGYLTRLFLTYNLANDKSISGTVFYDLNTNGIQDAGEEGIPRFPIQVAPDALAVFADDSGQFSIYGASGNYNISPELDDCWSLSTSPDAYDIVFDGTASIDTLRFGVTPNTQTPAAAVTLASAPTRCGFTVPFWLNYRNDGCWPFEGKVYMVLDDLVTFESAEPAPTSVSGDTLFWTFGELAPGASRSVELTMVIAGVDFIGSVIDINNGIIPFDASGQPLAAETFNFFSTINCAYDPNDKQVYPFRSEQPPFEENYTLFDESLLYTVRFQNTGTDTAFNIVIRDQLSTDLDWSSFRPGSSSHPYEATLHDDGLVEFHFRDILLPDSTTNEPESHGFVQFDIDALPGLAEGTIIENTAGIYFDFNPPIITNTVDNIMVETLPDFTPAAAFNYASQELTVSFTDLSTNEPLTWFWEFGDGNSDTVQNPEHIYAESGTYNVCLTAANDWGTNTYCEDIMLSVTSTVAPSLADGLKIYPNPANDLIKIETISTRTEPQLLTIYNAFGQALKSIMLTQDSINWDISDLPAGSYIIRTASGPVYSFAIVR